LPSSAIGREKRRSWRVDEILALNPDLLIGATALTAIAMSRRTSTIPIVMGTVSDAVGVGLAQSLRRPGGNVTGLSLQLHELGAKHIEIMNELMPRMRRVAVLSDLSQPKALSEQYERIAGKAAGVKKLALEVHGVDSVEDLRALFPILRTRQVGALLVNPSPRFNALRREVIELAAGIRLPSIGFVDAYAEEGGLISYAPSFVDAMRRPGDRAVRQRIRS
jgi:putative ABC transport system substrate-binding protein